ncbi:putative type II secretion system protein K [Marinobacterium sp. xm-g-59]|uniref:type II secretion system minor pseudopilin GspK n=1 Tax=Marinobacterium sp. xm-g-59 TaxID=2497748 RepID=UPI001567CBD6|nr:putative type II secretion system protein K [Marinobacterium sp. xm-g-59]
MIKQQRGAALIAVLLVMALIASLLAGYAYRESQVLDRFQMQKGTDRLVLLGMSAERWVLSQLRKDASQNRYDSFLDDWARDVPELPVEGGLLSGSLVDLERYININRFTHLSADEFEAEIKKEVSDITLLHRIASIAGQELSDDQMYSLIDWQDADDQSTRGGFESPEYQLLEVPYRAANSSLVDISELRLINGFSAAQVAALSTYLAAFPDDHTQINVNTTSKEVLMSLWDAIDIDVAEQLLAMREQSPWQTVDAFVIDLASVLEVDPSDVSAVLERKAYSPLAVESHYFRLSIKFDLDGLRMFYRAILKRSRVDNEVRVGVESRSIQFEKI